ncbi:peptidase M14 [Colwellia sp. MB02u-18]|uniref:M14 metallopeptidase family protein n=1 Tax=unclassified Colwellia TaxID=196834 RepID=UPI0015F5DDBA|nr:MULTISPECIES: M14 metallopeptidase family protein [unclassified Colwellia]MBA6222734.1 peptidase M14 [Colwellia sp. MB3u-45]MBA6266059.1 peptidase M14 [Colwellia sp. MB3u-43]MBA6320499.1 peptidase M14 [Colwellia sp. MB02u-19]MBA6323386.1 peptidase M14 [Colwellia sp. MB02u-18]MBA6329884.1 peptidase M14 [Colwellia sp. MB02u-12]
MLKKCSPLLFSLLISFVCSFTLLANSAEQMWPGSEYDNSIPTFADVLGYDVGEKITHYGDMLRYFEALERAAPKQIKLFEYGRTWEGRKLIYVAIGKSDVIDNLDDFANKMQKLSDPRITDKEAAKQLIAQLPASVWLGYGVHGNEISSTDAAMMTAYHLLAAPNEATNRKILKNTIVFIDPLQNPDGRSRFTSRYYATVGMQHSADRLSAEHNEPWPSGRSNHYLFDMNRDWLAITQPETAGRIRVMNHYRPLVVIDLHEMGGDSSYYFSPAAQPFNPHMTQTQIDNMTAIGKNHGKHFDRLGFDYFTREVFDAFYPGYGDSWPTFYGASASTYEVSSARGEIFKKKTGETLTYKDTVQRHFVASISTAEGVADRHDKLLNDYYHYQTSAIGAGKENKKERVYILPNRRNVAGGHRLATLMAQHGVEVKQADKAFKQCGKSYQAGAYFIDTAQPKGRFVTTTFTKQVDMAPAFVKEQERRRARKLADEIYDVTGWSLPLMFDVDVDACSKAVKVASHRVKSDDPLIGKVINPDASVAYLVSWGDMAAGRFLTAALQQNIIVKSADKAFTLAEKTYNAGTLIIEKRTNDDDLATKVMKIAKASGAQVQGVNSSWVTQGPSFGSSNTVTMTAPNIAMAWDEPVSSLSAGNTRFVIERQFNYPVTAIRTNTLKSANLSNYQVLILPSGDYKELLGISGAENIKQWVKRGGVLITLGSATQFAAEHDIALLDVKRERAFKDNKDDKSNAAKEVKEVEGESMVDGQLFTTKKALVSASENPKEKPDFVAGVLANIEVDQEHWLTAGVHNKLTAIAYGSDIYAPIKLASGKNLAWFTDAENVLASGYLWAENKKQLAYKPYLIHQPMEQGMVIAFTQEPTTRAYLDGLNIMLMNTIFRAAAHAKPLR